MSYCNPGDKVFIPNIGYPVYRDLLVKNNLVAGYYTMRPQNNYQIDFSELENMDLSRTKAMVINYPHNPTGSFGSDETLKKALEFCQKQNILLIHDFDSSELTHSGKLPKSIIEFDPQGENCAVVHTMSKSHNMPGMRVGFLVSNPKTIQNVLDVKNVSELGTYIAIQDAAAEALMDTKYIDKVNEWMALEAANPGYLDKHVLWYVVKEVGMKNGWHVNGVIVDYEVKNKSEISYDDLLNEVEIDIHQQIHQDWNEIKTSIHVRADVESIKINIPLNQADVIEKDDFAIRAFDFNYKEYNVTHTVTHDANGITIEISNIPAELIQELKQNFHDGLTIEIHSYCTTEDIWEQLSKSSVVKLGKPCTVKGQVSSALRPGEKVELYAPNTKK